MTRLRALLCALPIFIAAFYYGRTVGSGQLALVLLGPALLSLVRPGRTALTVPAQVLLLVGSGGLAMLLAALFPTDKGWSSEPLEPAYLVLGAGSILLAGVRLHLRAPVFSHAGTMGLGLLVFLACGTVKTGDRYLVGLVTYLVAAAWAIHEGAVADGRVAAGRDVRGRTVLAVLAMASLCAAMASGFAITIPRVHQFVYGMALDWIHARSVTGFHDGPMMLGALGGMLQSEEVVMRVEGDLGTHLRGNVYSRYRRGRWLPVSGLEEAVVELPALGDDPGRPPAGVAALQMVEADSDRFFVPAGSYALRTRPARLRVDSVGIVRADAESPPQALWARRAPQPTLALAEPGRHDLEVPDALRGELAERVHAWTRGATSDEERLERLKTQLETRYRYSIDFADADRRAAEEGAPEDPILRFLKDRPVGHCEYFASALTLLARAAGLPARMVTGYRVDERNPFGGYWIVRERHAHAWVEVHLAGRGWVTSDPSPLRASGLLLPETPQWAGLVDYLAVLWERKGAEAVVIVLVVGLSLAQIVRIVRGREQGEDEATQAFEPPPGHIVALLDRLREESLRGDPDPTLEALSRRLRRLSRGAPGAAERLREAAGLLDRHAAHRYGDQGDSGRIREDVERWLAATASRARS